MGGAFQIHGVKCSLGAYGRFIWISSLTSDSDMLMRRPMLKREWIRFCLGEKKTWKEKNGWNCHKQRKPFIYLYFNLMGLWLIRTKLYLLLLVDSWLPKRKNQFFTLRVRLTAKSQSRLRDHTPGCSAELGFKFPYGPKNQTGNRVWD